MTEREKNMCSRKAEVSTGFTRLSSKPKDVRTIHNFVSGCEEFLTNSVKCTNDIMDLLPIQLHRKFYLIFTCTKLALRMVDD